MIVMKTALLVLTVCSWYQVNAESSQVSLRNEQPEIKNSDSCSNMSLTCSELYADSCPPGLFCKQGYCQCGNSYPSIVHCTGSNITTRLSRFCITYERNVSFLGLCLLTTINMAKWDTQLLDKNACKYYNRTGPLCGRCLPEHYLLAYSFNLTCIPCPHAHRNWFRYIMAAYLPLTLFCFLVLFLKINTTSSHLFPVVYYCQVLSTPLLLRLIFNASPWYSHQLGIMPVAKVLFSLYGIWNLDFFRPFYSDLCLGIGVLPTLALDYAIAVYPLLLMIISYLLIVLHDRNCRVVTIPWTPFRFLFSLIRKNWDIRTSTIDAFATFFLLSNLKFLSTSFDLLVPTKVYQLYPDHYNYTWGLLYAPNIQYFGREHLPYAIPAILMLCTFFILPITILALYPHKLFARCCPDHYILRTFMDAFQGCYKDGTQPGTFNYRWFASLFFIIRLCYFISVPFSHYTTESIQLSLILLATLVAVFNPFKPSATHLNIITIIFLQFQLVLFTSINGLEDSDTHHNHNFHLAFVVILATIPLLYASGLVVHWVYMHKKSGVGLVQRVRAWRRGYVPLPEALPHRIENSEEYPRENLAKFTSPVEHVPVAEK